MAHLIYSAIASLDGYVADADGRFDWSMPDEEVHAVVNDLERRIGTFLCGRRLYEVMAVWDSVDTELLSPVEKEFADLWRAADKVVFSAAMPEPTAARTRVERRFDPESLRALKASAAKDLSVGGPELAAHAFRAGLVDECHLFLSPIIVGGGTRALPDAFRGNLELLDLRRFANGVVHLRYAVGQGAADRPGQAGQAG